MHLHHGTCLPLAVLFGLLAPLARADITVSGNYSPPESTDPGFWTAGGDASRDGSIATDPSSLGSLAVTGGSHLALDSGVLGVAAGSEGTATVTGSGSTWSMGEFVVGDLGSGSLTVADGGAVISYNGSVGNSAGSMGWVTVTGTGSRWNMSSGLAVGSDGAGTLIVANGGVVSNGRICSIGEIGGAGRVTVTGAGSQWIVNDALFIGGGNSGTLTVADNGSVRSTSSVYLMDTGRANLVVSRVAEGSSGVLLEATAGETYGIKNYGAITYYAAGGLDAGTYTPMVAAQGIVVEPGGKIVGVGGTVDADNGYSFVVGNILVEAAGLSGDDVAGERVQLNGLTGLVTAFGAGATDVTLSAAANEIATIEDELVLAAYDFANSSSALGDLVLLSMDIGTGQLEEDLSIWHSDDGTTWSLFDPGTFSYDEDGWVSFSVTGFSSYAVTSAVPEPAAGVLLALLGAVTLLRRRL